MKLIDLLVKELPQRSGWPEEAKIMSQDAAGLINAHRNERLVFLIDQFWTGTSKNDACKNFSPFYLKKATDWNTNTVTREQYEAALAASKAVVGHNGWIQWAGGDCPVDSDAIVEVRYRKPSPYQFNNDRAGDFIWLHTGSGGDIIAYRLHKPDANSRANDDRLEQDLNECIGQDVTSEWDGEGLPPAGCECEVMESNPRSAFAKWTPCTVIHFNLREGRESQACIIDNNGDFAILYGNDGVKFRPLRTEAEKAREAAETSMRTCLAGTGAGITQLAAKVIYDAIAEGKIPGVKLDGK